PYNHGFLASLLWKLGEPESALKRIEHAVKLELGYTWAWDALAHWSVELRHPERAEQIARELTIERAGEARSWLMFARTVRAPEQLDERLAALDKCVALNPRNLDAHDLRARLLSAVGRFDEALAACRPSMWEASPPARLRARAA